MQSAPVIDRKGRKKKQGSVTYSTEREDEISKILVIYLLCVSDVFKFLTLVEGKTSKFEIVVMSLARFNMLRVPL